MQEWDLFREAFDFENELTCKCRLIGLETDVQFQNSAEEGCEKASSGCGMCFNKTSGADYVVKAKVCFDLC